MEGVFFLILLKLIFDGEHHNLIENLFMKGGSLKKMLSWNLAPASSMLLLKSLADVGFLRRCRFSVFWSVF